MKTIALSWRYLVSRPLAASLNLLLLTLGLAAITFVLLTRAQIDRAFERDLAGIDAVVGAKGSPMQLITRWRWRVSGATTRRRRWWSRVCASWVRRPRSCHQKSAFSCPIWMPPVHSTSVARLMSSVPSATPILTAPWWSTPTPVPR